MYNTPFAMKKIILFALISMTFFTSCAKIYYAPDAREKASLHKVIAIVQPKVNVVSGKNTDATTIQKQEEADL